ncbi:MAG: hypothetical protein IKH86_07070, partial [Prevotella sp.]|nr:hypothetical protein [Prevotella sp.]
HAVNVAVAMMLLSTQAAMFFFVFIIVLFFIVINIVFCSLPGGASGSLPGPFPCSDNAKIGAFSASFQTIIA